MQVQTHHGLGLEVGAKRPLHLLQHICYQRKHPRCIQDGERFHHVFQRELIDQILLEVLELFLGQITAEAALDLIQSALGDDVLHGHHREIRRAKLHGGRCKQHVAGVPVAILTQLLIGLHIVAQKARVYLRVQMIQAVHEQLAHLCSDVAAALAHKQDHILFAGFSKIL